MISFTKQAAIEYAGIRANAICPGLIVTELSGGREAIEKFPHLVEGAPMRRCRRTRGGRRLACFLALRSRTVPHRRRHPDRRRPHRDNALMRPFRFGFTGGVSSSGPSCSNPRTVEALGYSTFGLADHFVRPLAPLIAGQAVADATTTLRVTQTVLAQDFRQPAVLAKELATLDVLSGGRLQVGLGAGWLRQEVRRRRHALRSRARSDRAARGDRDHPEGHLRGRTVHFLRRPLHGDRARGRPRRSRSRPPIMIGGGEQKVLGVAARQADIVQLMPSNRGGVTSLDPSQFSAPAIEDKIGWIREAAGSRFDEIELSAQLIECAVTERPTEYLADLADRIAGVVERMGGGRIDLGEEDLRRSPIVAVGSLDDVCETLVETRARYGISYFPRRSTPHPTCWHP